MSDDNLTVKVLIEIRNGIDRLGERVDLTNSRVDETNHRLERMNSELKEELVKTRLELRSDIAAVEMRQATRTIELTAAMRETNAMLLDRFDLRERVERVEKKVEELENKVG